MGETQSAYGNALKLLQDHWAECKDAGVQCDQIKFWQARGNEACYKRYDAFQYCYGALLAAGFSDDGGDGIFDDILAAQHGPWGAMSEEYKDTKYPWRTNMKALGE